MADPIEIDLRVTGAEQSAMAIERVDTAVEDLDESLRPLTSRIGGFVEGLGRIDEAERANMREQRAWVHNIGEMGQSATAVATMVQQLATAVGSGTGSRLAGLAGSMASGAAQGAAMGIALGPVGAGLGAVIGGLTPAIAALASGVDNANISFEHLAENARAAHTHLVEVREVVPEVEAAIARLNELTGEGFVAAFEAAPAENAGLNRILRGLNRREEEARGHGGGRREERPEPGAAMTEGALDEFTSDVSDRELARRAEADAEYAAQAEELADATIERLNAEAEAQQELFDLKEELRAEDLEAEREKQDYLREMEEQAAEEREQGIGELTAMAGRASKALFSAIAQVATGAKSGEDAFKGLLASFLQMISEYASLKAATEFADAAGSFARYDYGGGAAHIGAGLAFTAVAVATGVGAAALSQPPQQPARPEARSDGGGGATKGGDVIINWNSPVVTAGTRAELGRDLSSMIAEAGAA